MSRHSCTFGVIFLLEELQKWVSSDGHLPYFLMLP